MRDRNAHFNRKGWEMHIWCSPTKAGKCPVVEELREVKGRNPQNNNSDRFGSAFPLSCLLPFGNGAGQILNKREHAELFSADLQTQPLEEWNWLVLLICRDRTRDNGLRLTQGRFRWDMGKKKTQSKAR